MYLVLLKKPDFVVPQGGDSHNSTFDEFSKMVSNSLSHRERYELQSGFHKVKRKRVEADYGSKTFDLDTYYAEFSNFYKPLKLIIDKERKEMEGKK